MSAKAVEPERPSAHREQILLRADDFAAAGEQAYLAFPALIQINDRQVLISYKRGRSHALDPGALLEAICLDTESQEIVWRELLGQDPDQIQQMGEWIRFPSGRIGNFVDLQHAAMDGGRTRLHRLGCCWTFSDDGGKAFSAMRPMAPADGTNYGYIFDGVIVHDRVYMLAMTFPELTDRKSAVDEQGRRIYGEVAVLSSCDDGENWQQERNLTEEFGGTSINESALIEDGDGFIIVTRGYDNEARLQRVDGEFRLLKQSNLTDDNSFVGGQVGRPRLFRHDDRLYLMGRNSRGGPMELALFRVNPDSFDIERCVILDPVVEGTAIADGYYAAPYFRETDDGMLFNVVTYRREQGRPNPDIVRLEFAWDEVR